MQKHLSVVALLTLLSLNVIPLFAQTPAPATAPDAATLERRVESLLSKMTLEEKIDMVGGVDGFFVRAIPDSVAASEKADGPIGVRNFGPATAMAAGIVWPRRGIQPWPSASGLDRQRCAAKGVHFFWGRA